MKQHTHKYRRFLTARSKQLWRCVLAGCNHVIYQAELMPGRESICWRCGREFTLMPSNMDQNQPTCSDCREKRAYIADRFKGKTA